MSRSLLFYCVLLLPVVSPQGSILGHNLQFIREERLSIWAELRMSQVIEGEARQSLNGAEKTTFLSRGAQRPQVPIRWLGVFFKSLGCLCSSV